MKSMELIVTQNITSQEIVKQPAAPWLSATQLCTFKFALSFSFYDKLSAHYKYDYSYTQNNTNINTLFLYFHYCYNQYI